MSRKYQQSLVEKRDNSRAIPSTLNKYRPGDFVLFLYSVDGHQLNKLDAKFLGPYSVISHLKNDVTVRNLISDAISVYHVNRLKSFYGSKEQAYDAALRDADQYLIEQFIAYKGDPNIRTSIYFYIKFADGTYCWKPWSKDLFDTQQYEKFCSEVPELSQLVVLQKEATILRNILNSKPITEVKPGTTVFLDLRAIGAGWYQSLNLPNCDFTVYVVPLTYKSWRNAEHTRIDSVIPSLKMEWSGRNAVNHFFVKSWGNNLVLSPNMTLISLDFIQEYDLIARLKQN